MKNYPIRFEVAADFGNFADLTTGSESASYELPPPTACKGMIEAITWVRGVCLKVVAVATCTRPQSMPYAYNSFSSQRKSQLIVSGDACQIHETILWQPRYQIIAVLQNYSDAPRGHSPAHQMQHTFFERLVRGQSRYTVCLGRKEYLAKYVGLPITPVETSVRGVIPTMCLQILDRYSCIRRVYGHQLQIRQGILCFDQEIGAELEDGILTFSDTYLKREIAFLTQKWRGKQR